MCAIFKKEFKNYFSNYVGYVFLAIFSAISGLMFFLNVIKTGVADVSGFFNSIFLTVIFSIPILTMGLFSDEYRFNTDRLLFSSPVKNFSIVLEKYLAAFVVYLIAISFNLIYLVTISFFTSLQISLIVGCFCGTILIGAALIAVGIFVSSLTKNMVISAFGIFAIFILFVFIGDVGKHVPFKEVVQVLNGMAIMPRYGNFAMGLLNIPDIIYFFSMVIFFIFLTNIVLLKKRWS